MIADTKGKTLMDIMQERIVVPDSIVYTDAYHSYNAMDVSELKHYRINHSKLFANKNDHIIGIENFCNQTRHHMRKFNGDPKESFPSFLKEGEWRFSNINPKSQLKQSKQ